MIINGNMRYSPSGRETKRLALTKRSVSQSSNNKTPKPNPRLEAIKAHQEKYPSLPMGSSKPTKAEDNSYKQEISKQYTVAIPYNKGAYQVIPKENIKDIDG